MSMRHALLEEPPPSRHWDDPDLDDAPPTSPEYTWTWTPPPSPPSPSPSHPSPAASSPATAPAEPRLTGATLLMAASPVSGALFRELLGGGWGEGFSLVGRLVAHSPQGKGQPGREEEGEAPLPPGHADLYQHKGSRVFLALVDAGHVAAPHCFLLTRAFFQGAIPSRVLIFGPLPPGPFHSQLRTATGQEDIAGAVLVLHTAAHQDGTAHPHLPPGTLIDGLPASILSHCQARSIDASLWCCGFADGAPGADTRSSLESLASLVQQLAPSLALGLPEKVPPTAVTTALGVLKKKSTLPSDMYI